MANQIRKKSTNLVKIQGIFSVISSNVDEFGLFWRIWSKNLKINKRADAGP